MKTADQRMENAVCHGRLIVYVTWPNFLFTSQKSLSLHHHDDQVHSSFGRCREWNRKGCDWYDIDVLSVLRHDHVQVVIIASSTGLLLKTTGLKVTAIKIDPYMNIDAGTMRPQEHGEIGRAIVSHKKCCF